MAFAKGEFSVTLDDILSIVTEFDILEYYLGVKELPIVIQSPLREDNNPSFGLYTPDEIRVHYIDFATKDRGGLFDLLMKYWGEDFHSVLYRIWNDLPRFSNPNAIKLKSKGRIIKSSKSRISDLQCKVREWRDYDIEYWKSYGISLEWLKYADVYPISHKIVISEGHRYVFGADKYAYAYVERKESKVTLKIYQPFNKDGYKWSNKHDKSVISLWTKVPEYGNKICICSSLKDALCLSCNTGIPALSIQGEGYNISSTAVSELKRRYKHIYILLDNDEAGLKDGEKLSASTGFTNIVLPKFEGGKDISDYFKTLQNPIKFREKVLSLFKTKD